MVKPGKDASDIKLFGGEVKINCPECGHEIDVSSILSSKYEKEFEKKLKEQIDAEQKTYQIDLQKLEADKKEVLKQKEEQKLIIENKVKEKLKLEKKQLEKQLKSKIEEEESERIALLEEELKEKSEKVKWFNKTKAEFEKIKREKEELKEKFEADYQKMLNEKLSEEKEKIKKTEQDKQELKIKELKKQLDDQKILTAEMKRKQEQGSVQLQGEVQELAIEEWLAQNFPLDTITEIKKGARGADCIQTVHIRMKQNCGTIYYESKRTKVFKNAWIEKFKGDIRDKGANIGVLVTDAFPKDMERMGLMDGVWVCSYEEFKGLCFVLRESIIQISSAISSQENKGEKMLMLYDFLTSNEFRLQIEGIVEGFTQMQKDLDVEKRAIMKQWKKREKQIEKVLLNTINMYGSIKGIAGNAIQTIKTLELPEPTNGDIEEDNDN